MRGHALILAAVSVVFLGGGLAIGTGGALAESGSERSCESGGGTYVKDGADSTCTYPETTKDVNGNAYGTTTQETTTGHGNLDNKPVDACEGNVGQCKQQ